MSQHLDIEELGRNMAFRLGKGKGKTFIRFQHSFFKNCSKVAGGFPGGSDSKEFVCSVGDPGLIPRSGRSPGEGNGISL